VESLKTSAPTTVEEGELEVEHGCLVYSFDIRVSGKEGAEEVLIDAGTGKVLSHTHESAEEETAEQDQEEAEKRGTQERKGQERPADLVNELQQRYRARKQLRREFLQTLQQQMTTLHEHAAAMEGISDERQLLREMRKHMQMTDAVLGTLVEQRAAREAQKSIHGEQPGQQLGQPRQTEQSEPKEHKGDRGSE
jgi:iron-sulfur cluster repair protein YtfE (RIC family)